jgi:hypothetical protein
MVIQLQHVISAINRKGDTANLYVFSSAVANSKKFRAKVITKNVKYGLAIIKLEGSGFNYVSLGDSSKIEEGQPIALCGYGHVFGCIPPLVWDYQQYQSHGDSRTKYVFTFKQDDNGVKRSLYYLSIRLYRFSRE